MSVFELGKPQHLAAQLLADGELSNVEIAEKLDVTVQTLWNWRQRQDFAALIEEKRSRIAEDVMRRGLADRLHRVRALNDRWNRMRRVIEARADHPSYAGAPGGSTGLLVRTVKKIGTVTDGDGNERAELIEEFSVDTGLLCELRAHEKQAAQELGQWVERQDVKQTVKGNLDLVSALAELPTDDLDTLESFAEKLARRPREGAGPDPGGEVSAEPV